MSCYSVHYVRSVDVRLAASSQQAHLRARENSCRSTDSENKLHSHPCGRQQHEHFLRTRKPAQMGGVIDDEFVRGRPARSSLGAPTGVDPENVLPLVDYARWSTNVEVCGELFPKFV